MLTLEPANASQFERLVSIWESSVRATHFFLTESDITELRPLILNAYLPNLPVFIARDETGTIHGFIGVDGTHIEMLFIDAESRGKGIGAHLLTYAVEKLRADEVDVNEQNPQGVGFYKHMGFVQTGRSEVDGQGKPFPLLHMKYSR